MCAAQGSAYSTMSEKQPQLKWMGKDCVKLYLNAALVWFKPALCTWSDQKFNATTTHAGICVVLTFPLLETSLKRSPCLYPHCNLRQNTLSLNTFKLQNKNNKVQRVSQNSCWNPVNTSHGWDVFEHQSGFFLDGTQNVEYVDHVFTSPGTRLSLPLPPSLSLFFFCACREKVVDAETLKYNRKINVSWT